MFKQWGCCGSQPLFFYDSCREQTKQSDHAENTARKWYVKRFYYPGTQVINDPKAECLGDYFKKMRQDASVIDKTLVKKGFLY